jgi:hypothetical protein
MGESSAATKSLPPRVRALVEWFTRSDAIRAAKSDPAALDARQRSMLARARGALLVAERVSPSDGATVPLDDAGDEMARASTALAALRDAVSWALAAHTAETPGSLAEAWERVDAESLEGAAGSGDELARARRALFADDALTRSARSIDETRADLAAARRFAKTLIDRLEARATRSARLHAERWIRIVSVAALFVAVALAIDLVFIVRRPDLVPRAHWTASSADLGWPIAGVGMSGPRAGADVFFHTREQENPFVQFDLGSVRSIARVLVVNRTDCCQERAVPLAIEISNDARRWTEVARNSSPFDSWDELFWRRRRARYVRFVARRRTVLHLTRVEIH